MGRTPPRVLWDTLLFGAETGAVRLAGAFGDVQGARRDRILARTQPLKAENAGGAESHYLRLTRIMTNSRDPQEEALSILAEAL